MAEFRLAHTSLQTELVGTSLPHTPAVVGYNGVQYATVKQRWTRAALRTEYGSTYDARHFGPKCPQPEHLNNTSDYGPDIPFPECEIDEFDCLNLNVSTPREISGSFPVLFWIHGGSLLNGANSDSIWDANRLAQWAVDAGNPIVIVSVNYRLGPFGFFQPPARYALSNEMAKGNFGLHDQLLALQWVSAHIAGFGGDPERVTIGGESAGGCSVHAQIGYQEMTRGKRLFNRAIMQSGNLGVMGVWNSSRLQELWDGAVADAGLSMSADAVEALRSMAPRTLGTLATLDISGYGVFSDDVFVSEPIFGLDGRFLSQAPSLDAVMHGDNADEGNIFREAAGETSAMLALENIGESVLGRERLATVLDLYGLSEWRSLDAAERGKRLCRFPEDARFYLPTDELQLAWPSSALYHFAAKSPFATSAFPGDSFHTLELLHLFGNFDDFLRDQGNDRHLKLGEEMRKTWTGFLYGEEPWTRAFQGLAAVFSENGKNTVPANAARGWDADRSMRIRALHKVGYAEIVELATRVFP